MQTPLLVLAFALYSAAMGGCSAGGSGSDETRGSVVVPAAAANAGRAGARAGVRSPDVTNGCTGTGLQSFIGGGATNVAAGKDSAVVAGTSNEACSINSVIAGGTTNIISSSGGGGSVGFIGAGGNNLITMAESGFIGAGQSNTVSGNQGAVVAGAGNAAAGAEGFVGGGGGNTITSAATYGAIAAGETNTLSSKYGFIGAGLNNSVSGEGGYIAAGGYNTVSGEGAVIDGGFNSTASGTFATIPGGYVNAAAGTYSFAAGARASALQEGTFVWSDGSDGDTILTSTKAYEFLARASGGFTFYTNKGSTVGAQLGAGSGTWASLSDRNAKTNVAPLDEAWVLDQVAALPISRWSYKAEHGVRHVGPMAQDFYAAFRVGEDDRHITSIDEDGVALAAIKALHAENARLRARVVALQRAQTASARAQSAYQRATDAKFARIEARLAQ